MVRWKPLEAAGLPDPKALRPMRRHRARDVRLDEGRKKRWKPVGGVQARGYFYPLVNYCLVVLEHEIYDFPYVGVNHPNWLSYFSEGLKRLKPPTSSGKLTYSCGKSPWLIGKSTSWPPTNQGRSVISQFAMEAMAVAHLGIMQLVFFPSPALYIQR